MKLWGLRVDARGAYLLTLAGVLAYYAGQIIVQPSFATQQGLEPAADLVPMDVLGWAFMGCAAATAATAVAKARWLVLDRVGFALATFPLVVWFLAFGWSWIADGADGYPVGGTWFFYAAGITIVNMRLGRGHRSTTEDGDARRS
ncbi:hypothetical protein [Streptodolium elevatio]|uniref:SPW repeat-containing protein n=1 Tax=Streptodolium elevatio TaxID=3157996 RepID=A0ABV3DLF7_9ACTN